MGKRREEPHGSMFLYLLNGGSTMPHRDIALPPLVWLFGTTVVQCQIISLPYSLIIRPPLAQNFFFPLLKYSSSPCISPDPIKFYNRYHPPPSIFDSALQGRNMSCHTENLVQPLPLLFRFDDPF